MGEHQLFKIVAFLDDVHQGETESLASYYSRVNKNLADIDQVISEEEVVRAFTSRLSPRGSVVNDNHKVMPVHNSEKLAKTVKAYIDLERSEEETVRQGFVK